MTEAHVMALIERNSAAVQAMQDVVRELQQRSTAAEGQLVGLVGVCKGLSERVLALEVVKTGAEQGSFAWALVMLRQGNAMRRARWADATRVESFEWRHYIDSCPNEDLLATDWQKAY